MQPCRAPVRPRFVSSSTGDALPLDDAVAEHLHCHRGGRIEIAGPPGSGRTTAVRHLAAVLSDDFDVEYRVEKSGRSKLVIENATVVDVDSAANHEGEEVRTFQLAPWTDDDCIEFMMSRYPDRIDEMTAQFLTDDDRILLHGSARLCTLVLSRMAESPAGQAIREAILAELLERCAGDFQTLPNVNVLLATDVSVTHDQRRQPLNPWLL